MSLPSGYTQLEYIQASGTQWVDTGFTPNQDTRIVMDATLVNWSSNGGCFLFGSGYPVRQAGFEAYAYSTNFYAEYNGIEAGAQDTFSLGQRLSVDFNKNVCNATSEGRTVFSHTFTYATFQSVVNLALFVIPRATKYYGTIKLHSCEVYNNGTLIREFIPCKNASGTVGLWDDVNSVFYGNAGSGTFTAGPEIVVPPEEPPNAPTGLQTVLAVVLAWAAVDGAAGYNLYRNGTLIDSTTTTQYVDTGVSPNGTYTYGVTAVNSSGESAAATLTVYTRSGYFEYKPLVESANFP